MARKKVYRTNKGKMIDMEAMRAANEQAVAAGNMKVNAKGDELGKGGKVVKTVKERVNPYYEAKKQVARTSIKPPIKKKDAAINTPPEEIKEEPVQEFVVDDEPISVNEKTREDGSVYKEMMFADGSIATEEVKAAPTKKKAKKKASKKKKK
jgi:hypothetical protein